MRGNTWKGTIEGAGSLGASDMVMGSMGGHGSIVAGVDRHGLKNILGEKFVNVHFDRSKSGAEIQGCTVNNLLRGLFFINGNVLESFTALDLPGGIHAWDDILETIYINLTTIVTTEEFCSRFLVLCKSFASSASPSLAHILSGAISFTFTWTAHFNGYFTREQLHELRLGIAEAVDILTPHSKSTKTNNNQLHMNIYSSIIQLNDMLDHLSDDRHCQARGLQPSPARWAQQALLRQLESPSTAVATATTTTTTALNTVHYAWNPHPVLTLPTLPAIVGSIQSTAVDRRNTMKEELLKIAAAAVANSSASIELFGASALFANLSDSDEEDEEKDHLLNTSGGMTSGNATDGSSKPQRSSSAVSFALSSSASASASAVANANADTAAGGVPAEDNIFDNDNHLSQSLGHRKFYEASKLFFDDSYHIFASGNQRNSHANEHHNDSHFDSSNDHHNAFDKPERGQEPIRLPATFNLVQDPDKFDDLWVFDVLEIARQWTLVDHNMFLAIPLTALMGELTWTKPRHRADAGAIAIRRFTDRFNAISTWTSHTILQNTTAAGRANILEQLIELCVCFESLGNYSSLMAVLAGISQGCISRLAQTKKLVKRTSSEKLLRLQRLMSGEKNYANYRNTVQQRASAIIIPNEWIRRQSSSDSNPSKLPTPPTPTTATATATATAATTREGVGSGGRVIGEGTVPHLGAHLAECITIVEGNPHYLPHAPQSLNMNKLRYLAKSVKIIGRLQRARYNLTPVRLLATIINKAIQKHSYLSKDEEKEFSKQLYDLSLSREGIDYGDGAASTNRSGSALRIRVGNDDNASANDDNGEYD